MTLFLVSTIHFCTKLHIITSTNYLLAVDTGRPPQEKHHIPPVCCGIHRSLQNNTIYSSPLLWYTYRSPRLTPYPISFVVPKGLPKLTPSPSFAVVSTGLPCHVFVVITFHTHMQGFRATCTSPTHCSLIRSVLALVGQSHLLDYLAC